MLYFFVSLGSCPVIFNLMFEANPGLVKTWCAGILLGPLYSCDMVCSEVSAWVPWEGGGSPVILCVPVVQWLFNTGTTENPIVLA